MDRIHAFVEARATAPTTQDIRADFHFRMRSESTVERALEGLASSGHLTRVKGQWQLKQPDVQLHIPLTAGETRSAGLPPR